jgi:ATP-dependent DNA helicase PIF1
VQSILSIPRIKLFSKDGDLPYTLERVQFPVRPCFAITVNKSQGQSLHTVGVDLQLPAFSHGQLYVALSRVTDVYELSLLLREDVSTIRNIVYPELLQFLHVRIT